MERQLRERTRAKLMDLYERLLDRASRYRLNECSQGITARVLYAVRVAVEWEV
jgi:hypothetical protein